ncbi:IS630 family transposase [Corallococcus macrosporus]|uniref:IS630 family transposase n=1 Tax=Corallococcus macrosporus TaxID=35 RepID=A0ABS3D637_9BACT|nr:IS630 family transposase [Corallococcus macrosporus]MBN8226501.1 IS630 family transposase [Corallococcus macrosporus]
MGKAAELKPSRLHFIDETAATLSMMCRYGRARRGARARGYVPLGRWQVLTIIGDLTLQGVGPVLTFEGVTNGERIETYVREGLLPILKPDDVVVMDNLSVHHRPAVEALIRSREAHLLFLPPYSPDLNPIKSCWLKVKTRLRAIGARTHAALIQAMREAISTVLPQAPAAWFSYCGYPPQPPRSPLSLGMCKPSVLHRPPGASPSERRVGDFLNRFVHTCQMGGTFSCGAP